MACSSVSHAQKQHLHMNGNSQMKWDKETDDGKRRKVNMEAVKGEHEIKNPKRPNYQRGTYQLFTPLYVLSYSLHGLLR